MFDFIPSPAMFGFLMFLSYSIVAVNYRAIAFKKYWWIGVTDAGICLINFSLIAKIADATSFADQVGYTIGGIVGGLAGVWLSDHWKDDKA